MRVGRRGMSKGGCYQQPSSLIFFFFFLKFLHLSSLLTLKPSVSKPQAILKATGRYFRLHSRPIEMGHGNQPGAWRGPHGPQRSRCPGFDQVLPSVGGKKVLYIFILKLSHRHQFTCYFSQKDGGRWQVSQQTATRGSDRCNVETAEL